MSTTDNHWQDFFENWPNSLARGGVLVTSFGEQIPFCSFSTKDGLLLLQRMTPDSLGARHVILSFNQIFCYKVTAVISDDVFTEAGFSGELAPA